MSIKKRGDSTSMAKWANISQKWLDLLIPYSNGYNASYSGAELARISKLPQRTVARHLKNLVNNNLLRFKKEGKNNKYYIDINDKKGKIFITLIEDYKAFLFLNNANIWHVVMELMDFGTVILFGSYAKGYATKDSDIDMMLIGKPSVKANLAARRFDKVNLHTLNLAKFVQLLRKKNTLAVEIVRSHVIFGQSDEFIDVCWRFYANEL